VTSHNTLAGRRSRGLLGLFCAPLRQYPKPDRCLTAICCANAASTMLKGSWGDGRRCGFINMLARLHAASVSAGKGSLESTAARNAAAAAVTTDAFSLDLGPLREGHSCMSWPSQAVLRLFIAHLQSAVLTAGLLPLLLLGRQHYSYGRQHYIIQRAPPPLHTQQVLLRRPYDLLALCCVDCWPAKPWQCCCLQRLPAAIKGCLSTST
jgi:hypothetical protein